MEELESHFDHIAFIISEEGSQVPIDKRLEHAIDEVFMKWGITQGDKRGQQLMHPLLIPTPPQKEP